MKKEEKREIIEKFIKSHLNKMTYHEMAMELNKKHGFKLNGESVRHYKRFMGLGKKEIQTSPEEVVEKDKIKTKERAFESMTSKKYKLLIKENEQLRNLLDAQKTIKDINNYEIRGSTNKIGDATAVIVASDWHFWETVNADQVDNLNEFNKKIADKRAELFFKNSARLLKREQRDSNIKTAVLALLGDFISNGIHPELMESNQGLPIDELMAVQSALVSGIQYLLDNTDVNFILPCHSGNHGRATEKNRISTEAGNSFEYLMYHNIANYFKDEPRLKFLISRGYLSYLDVSGFIIRFHHGHAIKYGGGIGGIFIPTFKAISQWDKARRADLDVFGHFHQMKDGGKFLCNGSLVGYNDYALRIKADYEKPKQVFFIINHEKREKTTTCPIFLE